MMAIVPMTYGRHVPIISDKVKVSIHHFLNNCLTCTFMLLVSCLFSLKLQHHLVAFPFCKLNNNFIRHLDMVEVYDLSMKYEPFALKQLAGCKLWGFQKVEWINNCFHIVRRFNTAFENRVLGPLELYAIFHFLSN